MDAAKEYAKEQGWGSRISFKKTPRVTVKLISDEKRTIQDSNGKDIDGVAIKVEMNGEEKEIFTSSASLITQLVDYEAGETVVIEMKRIKTNAGYRSTFEISKDGEENIPIIEEDEVNVEDIPL